MPDTPSSSQRERPGAMRRDRSRGAPPAPGDSTLVDRRATLASLVPRRPTVSWWLGLVLAASLAALVTPVITAERWLLRFHPSRVSDTGAVLEPGTIIEAQAAPFTVRAPVFAGYDHLRVGGGVVVARGETASRDEATISDAIAGTMPRGPVLYAAFFALIFVLAAIFTYHLRRSTRGRLLRVQLVSFLLLAVLAVAVKLVLLSTALSAFVVPVAVLALVPTLVLDRTVGLATGVLAALVVSVLSPFDVGLAILLLVQAATAGLVVAERPKQRWRAALVGGLVATLCTSATYLLLTYLTTGQLPDLHDPLHAPWVAAAIGPALAALLAVPLVPIYQRLVGEITRGKLVALEDLDHPLLRQIADKAPGTWQHSLMMANMAEIAANAIGASGRLVRVGAYFHDLGKSLSPRYFIENLEPGATSPHDQLPPEVSCGAIFAHVTEGIASARKAGLHERIVDFMHMHHGNEVLDYFWAKCREQGNPNDLTVDDFRYPGHPPQSRETAILAICDAVEAASRTLQKPDAAEIDALVQRIVYGKLHLGQLDESGLSMSDLRRISDSLRETIRHANHGRIAYPWQKAEQDASATAKPYTTTSPLLDLLDRKPSRERPAPPSAADSDDALAATADVKNPASEQRIPVARSTLAGDARGASPRGTGAPSDAGKIRAGTARNTHGSTPPVEVTTTPATGPAKPADAAGAAEAAHVPHWLAPEHGGDRPPLAERPPPSRGPAVPMIEAGSAPIREVPSTIPGRAPGPLPPPRDAAPVPAFGPPPPALPTFDHDPPSAEQTFDHDPPPAEQTFDDPPPPEATFDHDPPPAAQVFSPEPTPAARTRAAALAPAQPRRSPTVPPPLASRRATGDPGRTAGPPTPVDLDNAITNPPPMRRGASGHPPVPSDPAQLAADLASTVSRASSGPFPMPRPPRDAAPKATRHADPDNAITNPPPPGAPPRTTPRHVDLDDAITNPPPGTPPYGASISGASRPRPPAPGSARDHANPPPAPAGAQLAGLDHARADRASLDAPRTIEIDRAIANLGLIEAPRTTEIDRAIAGLGSLEAPRTAEIDHTSEDPGSLDARPTVEIIRPASTDPAPPAEPHPAELVDSAITQPSMPAAPPEAAPAHVVDSAITEPSLSSAPVPEAGPATDLDPPTALGDGSTAARRTTGLADGDRRAPPGEALPGHGEAGAPVAAHRSDPSQAPGAPGAPAAPAAPPAVSVAELAGRAASTGRPVARLAELRREDEARMSAARAAARLRSDGDARAPGDRRDANERDFDAGVTEPSLPILAVGDERRVDLPLGTPAPAATSAEPARKAGWASGLAARIDAALDSDEWSRETPVVAPTKAELRVLLGQPDPTRQQPLDEVALLQRRAAEMREAGSSRSAHPTTEVDPDDIEAAIELAPPARRPSHANRVHVAKPKKPE
jgi:putative nucleotidyltransferase with HDIG domain